MKLITAWLVKMHSTGDTPCAVIIGARTGREAVIEAYRLWDWPQETERLFHTVAVEQVRTIEEVTIRGRTTA